MAFERVSKAASIPTLFAAVLFYLATTVQATATGLLRDADIEHALVQLSAPILRAAGLPQSTRVLLVDDPSFNAFVIDNKTIFFNYGLISKIGHAGVVQAVIAHEAAHIANGHITRRMANLKSARTAAGLGLALAAIAAAAGAGEAAAGIAVGTQTSALRSFLAHTRAEEASADRSAAAYMSRADVSPRFLVDLHETFRGQELLSPSRQDPYMRSHPLTQDRLRAARAYVAAHGDNAPENLDADYWFARARGKITAYTRAPKWTRQRMREESHADIRFMREAISYHRERDLPKSLTAINQALALRPTDAYYMDLKGQILMENRRWTDALAVYKTAVDLAPKDALILGGYGRALLASGQPKAAIDVMEKARQRDFRDVRLLRDMSLAYAKTNQNGMAAVVTAERYALQGRLKDAGLHARRAVAQLPRGSAAWRRAEDILIAAERFEKGKKR